MYTSVIVMTLLAAAIMAAPNNIRPHQRDMASATSTVEFEFPTPFPETGEWAGVYICEDHHWGGKCEYKVSHLGSAPEDCVELDGSASSIGPDQGYYCIFYTNAFCRRLASDGSDNISVSYPGEPNLLDTHAGNWNDKVRSYNCFKDDDFEASDK